MTEAEWLECNDPTPMLEFLRGKATDRKLRLSACACCRRVWHLLLDERSRKAVEVAERCEDWSVVNMNRTTAWGAAVQAVNDLSERYGGQWGGPLYSPSNPKYQKGWMQIKAAESATLTVSDPEQDENAWDVAFSAAEQTAVAARLEREGSGSEPERTVRLWQAERQQQANILRCIFGIPFHPVTADPSWLTSTVLALANGIYDDRAFDRMPILADALEDAGCHDLDIRTHCRQPGPHALGCWVIDSILRRD